MLRNFTSIVLGISIGMVIMMLMHYLSMLFYPLPEGVSMSDTEKFNQYLETAKTQRKYTRIFPNKPWFNKNCNSFRKNYLQLKFRRGKKWSEAKDSTFKEYKNVLGTRKKEFKKETETKLRSLKKNDTREYYNIINSATNCGKKETNISIDSLFGHFQKLSFKEQCEDTFDPRVAAKDGTVNEQLNSDFSFSDVSECIKKLRNNKACGTDNIINEYVKNSPPIVIMLIVNLFNLILRTGFVPIEWSIGLILPIYKNKGSKKSPDNYRGITLLCCLGKLFTSVLNNRASKYVVNRGILGEEQAGFRPGYSTLDHTFVLDCLVQLYKARYAQLYCAFIDYKKAFDLINRSFLWMKLISSEINGNFIRVIYNIYKNAKSCIKKGDEISDFFLCNIGVRQGDNLSPLLFSIFLNDFETHLRTKYDGLTTVSRLCSSLLEDEDIAIFVNLFCLLYADDTIVLAESEETLQSALVGVFEYCDMWDLTVNVDKTKIMIFSRGKIVKHRNFLFGSMPLEVVDEYTYLGMLFNYNGTYCKAIDKQIQQATKAMYSLLTKARRLCLPMDITCDLFEKTVVPVLTYSCEIWGCGNITPIEIFYKKFLKMLLKLNNYTPSVMILGEVGRVPMRETIHKRMISFWIKVSEDRPSKYSNIIYRLMHKIHITKNYHDFKWFTKIEQILSSCRFSNLWRDQENYATKQLLKNNIFHELHNLEKQQWLEEVNTNRFCYNYRIFKQNLSFENYLTNLPFLHRLNFSKFRCKNNKLPVNLNRFSKTEIDRNCQLCHSGDLGDEFHYLLLCKFFVNERKNYLSEYYYKNPNTLKFNELFNNEDQNTLINTCKFIAIIMEKFNQLQ